jgi:hypothetical protein
MIHGKMCRTGLGDFKKKWDISIFCFEGVGEREDSIDSAIPLDTSSSLG